MKLSLIVSILIFLLSFTSCSPRLNKSGNDTDADTDARKELMEMQKNYNKKEAKLIILQSGHVPFPFHRKIRIYSLSFFPFSCHTIEKASFDRAFLIQRLRDFPLEWLDNIKMIKTFAISEKHIIQICNDISEGADNNLRGKIRAGTPS